MSRLRTDSNGNIVQGFDFLPGGTQIVTISGVSAPITNPVGANTNWVLIWATTACYFRKGLAPTAAADANSTPIPANTPFFVPINPGEKVAFIQVAAGGSGFVAECA